MTTLEKIKVKYITHSQGDTERKPNIIEIDSGGIKFKVHRHIYYPDTWLLSCRRMGIEHENLKTDDLPEALEKAKMFILSAIEDEIAVLKQAKEVLEESGELKM